MADGLGDSALDYRGYPGPGQLAIQATKPMVGQRDPSLAYSPDVAAACEEIGRELISEHGDLTSTDTALGLGRKTLHGKMWKYQLETSDHR